MNKILQKRHKRQVARAKAKVKLSEPDVRTHEEIEAAREASRFDASRGAGSSLSATGRTVGHNPSTTSGSAAKTSV
jgi:hypothetical protein